MRQASRPIAVAVRPPLFLGRSRFWLALLAFLLGMVIASHAEARGRCVTLQLRPLILISLGDVDVQVRVARHADHRALLVSWDSATGFAGSRTFALNADHDRVLFQWWNKDQPAAAYVYEARVFDDRGRSLDVDRKEIHTADIPQ